MPNRFLILHGAGEPVFLYEVFGRYGSTTKASIENNSGICLGGKSFGSRQPSKRSPDIPTGARFLRTAFGDSVRDGCLADPD